MDEQESEITDSKTKKQSLSFGHPIKGKGFGFHVTGINYYIESKGKYLLMNDEELKAGVIRAV